MKYQLFKGEQSLYERAQNLMMDTKPVPGFYDLCVNISEDSLELRATLSQLYKLGFGTVALNYSLDESVLTKVKKKKKKEDNVSGKAVLPEPINMDKLVEEFSGKLNIISRITFIFSDPGKTHLLAHCANLKKYHLYAVRPKTQNALQFACSQLNADVISLKLANTGLKLNRKLYQQAVERGLHFEIRYSDVVDIESRKHAIHNSLLLYVYGKSKNVIVSSGASDSKMIRNPYDIINLSSILGMNEFKSKASILQQCKTLLLRAEKRRRGKAVFAMETRVHNHEDLAVQKISK